ncbi:MAG TPA: septum formation initiator family protein [Terriglobales bacterium]|nr:septum formation initiator family protein [Terriglobales bacterium]
MRFSIQPLKQRLKFPRQRLVRRLCLLAMVSVAAWMGMHVVFGSQGLLALRHRQQQVAATMQHIHQLEDQNRQLNRSVRELRTDPQSIETIAREQLHLTRPGEVVYTYPPKPAASGTHAAELH